MRPVVVCNDALSLTVVPEVGARISQLVDRTGRSWLVETARPEPRFAPDIACDAVHFEDGTRGGWDECLPSIAPTNDSPDHGDFWFRPWELLDCAPDRASFRAPATRQPVELSKTVCVLSDRPMVRVELEARNLGEQDYTFIYSCHPLFRWPATATIEVPGAGQVRRAFGTVPPDLSAPVARRGPAENYKVFVRWAGRARAEFADGAGALIVGAEGGLVTSWLGICVNRGAWPPGEPGESWIALEPATAPTDSLDEARASGAAVVLAPGAAVRWAVTVEVEAAA